MKNSRWIGIASAAVVVLSCFMPWTYYPDLRIHFTGFYSQANMYGRPGKVLLLLAAMSIVLFAVQRIWAVRANMLLSAMLLAYCVKTFVLFTGCYGGICPEKEWGIYILMFSAVLMFVATLLPKIPLNEDEIA